MKKAMTIVGPLFLTLALMTACTKETEDTEGDGAVIKPIQESALGKDPSALIDLSPGAELLCLAETEEEAQEIAQLYGISLVGFSSGVATFHCEEDPYELIQRGKDNGWPLLDLNEVITLDDPVFNPGAVTY